MLIIIIIIIITNTNSSQSETASNLTIKSIFHSNLKSNCSNGKQAGTYQGVKAEGSHTHTHTHTHKYFGDDKRLEERHLLPNGNKCTTFES